jgi:hypothetical protein
MNRAERLNACKTLAEVRAWMKEADEIAAAIPNQRPWLSDLQIVATRQYLKKLFGNKEPSKELHGMSTIKPVATQG